MTKTISHLGAALGFALAIAAALAAQAPEDHKLLPSTGSAGDSFGAAVACDGQFVVVGSPGAAPSGTGSGTAHVFVAGDGSQLFELVPADGAAGDRFGAAVAIDNGVVLVGAPLADAAGTDSGAVYVFDASTGFELLKLVPGDAAAGDQFGLAVAMHGYRAIVGNLGAAYLFDVLAAQQVAKLLPIGGTTTLGLSGFGEAVDLDAGYAVVGARLENGISGLAGAVYVYDATTGTQLHRLVAADGTAWANFGASVAVRGSLIVIGAPEASPIFWHSGAAYLFDAVTGQQTSAIVPADGHLQAKFGSSVDADGPHIVIGSEQNNANGAFTSGAVYLHAAPTGSFVGKLLASDAAVGDELGGAVAAANGMLIAGAARDDDLGVDSGSAYVFAAAGTVAPITGCSGNTGTLSHVGGVAVAGQALQFRADAAQSGATFVLLALAAAPVAGWPSCGVGLGGAGELLIDAPAALLATVWTGSAADFAFALPPRSGLVGFPIYLQGAFVAASPVVEPLRLTGALQVVLGGYL